MRYNGVDPVPDEAKFRVVRLEEAWQTEGGVFDSLPEPARPSQRSGRSNTGLRQGVCTFGRLGIAGPEAEAGYLPGLKNIAIELGVDDRVSFTVGFLTMKRVKRSVTPTYSCFRRSMKTLRM